MRLGKSKKPTCSRADVLTKPKNCAANSLVGQLSSDSITTYWAPQLLAQAQQQLEDYNTQLLYYSDRLQECQDPSSLSSQQTNTQTQTCPNRPIPPHPPLFQSHYHVQQLEEMLTDASDYFQSTTSGGWKVQANAARFERRMEEKFGVLRQFLRGRPEWEHRVLTLQRKYAQGDFSPFRQGKPPISKATAVMVLFMMQRGNVGWKVLLLSTLYLVIGLQPWALIVIVAGTMRILDNRKKRTLGPMPKHAIASVEPYYGAVGNKDGKSSDAATMDDAQKRKVLQQPVGSPAPNNEPIDGSLYDTILLGYGPDALYTAALLSRAGRKVLVISQRPDASGCLTLPELTTSTSKTKAFAGLPFDVDMNCLSSLSSHIPLLAPALATTADDMGGIRFAPIAQPGEAMELFSIPGIGSQEDNLFAVRAGGLSNLMEDAALELGDGWPDLEGGMGNSSTGIYVSSCRAVDQSSPDYYLSKLVPEAVNDLRTTSTYGESAIRNASHFLQRGFPINPKTRAVMAAMGMKEECIPPSQASLGAHASNISQLLGDDGLQYPIGGPRALCHALATVVEQNGGRILTGLQPQTLLMKDAEESTNQTTTDDKKTEPPKPRCTGVQFTDGRKVELDQTQWDTHEPVVVCMHGFIPTFIHMFPAEVRAVHKVPQGLPALEEQRPVFKIMFGIAGSASELELPKVDYYRFPPAFSDDGVVPQAGDTSETPADSQETPATPSDEANQEELNAETTTTVTEPKPKSKSVPSKNYKRFRPKESWMKVSFPSAKDPSFELVHGNVSTCVVTIEADDDFVTTLETKPKLYGSKEGGDTRRLLETVRDDLLEIYPQLKEKVALMQLIGPLHRGLSQSRERFAAKGIRPETPYPGLYVGGHDLTVCSMEGAIKAAWLVANAVVGYDWLDYFFLEKDLTSDLSRHLVPGDEEVEAVPLPTEEQDLLED
eukprot:Nitzschia sp. Nitz4//scaffold2_size372955//144950//147860//NITZ4_000405-RA/size372955-snap-gene-0.76-mRNA-1//-1//CDS//3329546724//1450//frame0